MTAASRSAEAWPRSRPYSAFYVVSRTAGTRPSPNRGRALAEAAGGSGAALRHIQRLGEHDRDRLARSHRISSPCIGTMRWFFDPTLRHYEAQ